jgi:acetylglutamate kinase
VKLVVKIGGAALEDAAVVRRFAHVVADLVHGGHRVLVVHGGGSALSAILRELGRETTFVDGLRVTDAATRDVAVMVLAGLANKKLVAAIGTAGVPTIGLCGGDLHLVRAKRKHARADLGFVGEVTAVDAAWIERLWSLGAVPALASIALGTDGEYYNVNADEVASACASALKAEALVFLTDVPGVRGADGLLLRSLDMAHIPSMVERAIVTGGMLPKLEACNRALRRGVGRVHILPAARADDVRAITNGGIECGTEVVAR